MHECPRTPLSCAAPCGGRQLCLKGSNEVEPTKAWIQDRPSVQVARNKSSQVVRAAEFTGEQRVLRDLLGADAFSEGLISNRAVRATGRNRSCSA